jgi:cysteine-rich repeat protein
LPCFQTSDCAQGQTCVAGGGTGTQPNAPQQRPNDCSGDKFICGGAADEQCATTEKSSCSDQPYRGCETDEDCENFNAGFCNFEARPCFESRITRTGSPSPLGSYCAIEDKVCAMNADCSEVETDYCAADSARGERVALFCIPATSNSAVNNAGGLTGPGAVRFSGFTQVCRCGDGRIGCDEECDDSNVVNGDGCDDLCQHEVVP